MGVQVMAMWSMALFLFWDALPIASCEGESLTNQRSLFRLHYGMDFAMDHARFSCGVWRTALGGFESRFSRA